jgi:chemotaxis signal transduction protein
VEVLLLPVDEELYAVPMTAVREVVADPRVSPLPAAPASVLGLLNVRGEIVPLFDVLALLSTGKTSRQGFAAVVEVAAGPAAIAASAPPIAMPLGARVSEPAGPAALGVYDQDGRLSTLIDLEALLTRTS